MSCSPSCSVTARSGVWRTVAGIGLRGLAASSRSRVRPAAAQWPVASPSHRSSAEPSAKRLLTGHGPRRRPDTITAAGRGVSRREPARAGRRGDRGDAALVHRPTKTLPSAALQSACHRGGPARARSRRRAGGTDEGRLLVSACGGSRRGKKLVGGTYRACAARVGPSYHPPQRASSTIKKGSVLRRGGGLGFPAL